MAASTPKSKVNTPSKQLSTKTKTPATKTTAMKSTKAKAKTKAKTKAPKSTKKITKATTPKILPPTPTFSTTVHCLRSLPWTPSPILSLSSHPTLPLLAISRSHGTLSLHSLTSSLLPLAVLNLTRNTSVTNQLWLHNNLYVTTQTHLHRVDFSTLTLTNTTDLASPLPTRAMVAYENYLAVSTTSGVQFLHPAATDSNPLELAGRLPIPTTTAAKVTSLYWGNGSAKLFAPETKESKAVGNEELESVSRISPVSESPRELPPIIVGFSDGTLRTYALTLSPSNTIHATPTTRVSLPNSPTSGMLVAPSARVKNSGKSSVYATTITLVSGTIYCGDNLGFLHTIIPATATIASTTTLSDVPILSLNPTRTTPTTPPVLHCIAGAHVLQLTLPTRPTAAVVATTLSRQHTHPLNTLAVVNDTLYAGGGDAKLSVVSSGARPTFVYPFPDKSPVVLSGRGVGVVENCQEEGRVVLYGVDKVEEEGMGGSERGSRVLATIVSEPNNAGKGNAGGDHFNIKAAAASNSGEFIVASSGGGTKVYRISYGDDEGEGEGSTDGNVVVEELTIDEESEIADASATLVTFVDDNTFALQCDDGDTIVCEIGEEGEVVEKRTYGAPEIFGEEGGQPVPATLMTASSDGRFLAVGRPLAGVGGVVVYDLSDAGSEKAYWNVPTCEQPVTALRFQRSPRRGGKVMESVLCAATSGSEFYFYDVEKKEMSEWSQRAGLPVGKHLPRELVERKDYPFEIAFDPNEPSQFMLVYHAFFCLIDLDTKIPKEVLYHPPNCLQALSAKKRRREVGGGEGAADKMRRSSIGSDDGGKRGWKKKKKEMRQEEERRIMELEGPATVESVKKVESIERNAATERNCRMVMNYTNMVFMDFLSDSEMVVVEMPWARCSEGLGGVMEKKVYGN